MPAPQGNDIGDGGGFQAGVDAERLTISLYWQWLKSTVVWVKNWAMRDAANNPIVFMYFGGTVTQTRMQRIHKSDFNTNF